MSALDGRAPFIIDIRDLGRRAGAMVSVSLREAAPTDLTNAMIGVPQGSPIHLDLRLESVIEGVLVSGTATARLEGSCGRCLCSVVDEMEIGIAELFRYSDQAEPDDEGTPVLRGDLLDLEPTLRDSLVLALPLAPLCGDDCPGLCPECGVRLADEKNAGHEHRRADPRWAALGGLN